MLARPLILSSIATAIALSGCLFKPDPPGLGGSGSDGGAGSDTAPSDADTIPGHVTALAVGNSHACAISEGAVYCWGSNGGEEVVPNANAIVAKPTTTLNRASGWTSIAVGDEHTCGIDNDVITCWGNNYAAQVTGEVADGVDIAQLQLALPAGAGTPKRVFAGATYSCALDDAGTIYCWGQLDGTELVGIVEQNPLGQTSGWADLAISYDHACAISANQGQVACWGNNQQFQLGGTTGSSDVTAAQAVLKLQAGSSSPELFVSIAVIDSETCGVRAAGDIVCWGADYDERFAGGGSSQPEVHISAPSGHTWKVVSLGYSNVCATDTNGAVYCWGDDDSGGRGDGLGPGGGEQDFTAAPIMTAKPNAQAIGLGGGYGCAIDASDNVKCWGANDVGELGVGYVASQPLPVKVASVPGAAGQIAVGYDHTCAAFDPTVMPPNVPSPTNLQVYCWGANDQNQVSAATSPFVLAPTLNPGVGSSAIDQLTTGWSHTCAHAIGSQNSKCWGDSAAQQLGSSPTNNVGTLPYTVVQAGENTTCGWGGAASMQCTGAIPTTNGNEGQHTYAGVMWPRFAVSSEEVAGVGAGTDDSVRIIGKDEFFMPGTAQTGGTVDFTSAAGAGQTDAVFAVGEDQACGLFDGAAVTLQCWGGNGYGEVDNGHSSMASRGATTVTTSAGWQFGPGALSAGGFHTCALTATGQIYCWGDDSYQESGSGGGDQPVLIPLPSAVASWRAVATGKRDTCAIANDFTVWCWGFNEYGEVGNGETFLGTPTLTLPLSP